MQQLSKRLTAVASMVSSNTRLADVGCDHGFVPIYLVEQGICEHALALDVNEGPLMRAKEHIELAGLQDRIETRLGNGLEKVEPGTVDSILIAGMGGELIISILEAGKECARAAKELILSPHTDVDQVRAYLVSEGYELLEERCVFDEGKYYFMMRVRFKENADEKRTNASYSKTELLYGPCLLKDKDAVLLSYLKEEYQKLSSRLEAMEKQYVSSVSNSKDLPGLAEGISRTREQRKSCEDALGYFGE